MGRGRKPGPQIRVPVDIADKPQPDGLVATEFRIALHTLMEADLCRRQKRPTPKVHGVRYHDLARLVVRYGTSADELLAMKWLPYAERQHLRAIRRQRKVGGAHD